VSTSDERNSRHRRDPVAFTGVQGNDLRVIVVQDSRKGIKDSAAKFVHVRLSGVGRSASAEFAFAGVVALGANEDEGNPYPYG
jgi:hypothetical protein